MSVCLSLSCCQQVPSLNTTPLEQLPDGCLVRYRGMIQDQFDPELYLKQYTAVDAASGHQVRPVCVCVCMRNE